MAKKKSVSAGFSPRNVVMGLGVIVLLILFTLLGILFRDDHRAHQQLEFLSTWVATTGNLVTGSYVPRPAVSPTDNKAYFTDLHIKLPLDTLTTHLLYSVRAESSYNPSGMQVTDVTTDYDAANPPAMNQQFACVPVRLAFESKANPYNPHEIVQKSVKLADGRTLQIYKADEKSCNQRWAQTHTDPQKIADEFQQAQSY